MRDTTSGELVRLFEAKKHAELPGKRQIPANPGPCRQAARGPQKGEDQASTEKEKGDCQYGVTRLQLPEQHADPAYHSPSAIDKPFYYTSMTPENRLRNAAPACPRQPQMWTGLSGDGGWGRAYNVGTEHDDFASVHKRCSDGYGRIHGQG